MRRCNSWCSIKVPEVEKYVKLMRLFKKKKERKKDETWLQSWILFMAFLLNPREFLYPAVTMRFLKGNDVNVGIFSLLL